MEKMNVVGFRMVDFEDEKSGRHIAGVSLYVTHPEDNVQGEMAEKIFLSSELMYTLGYKPIVGDYIAVGYGRRGRIVSVEVCKK